MQHLDLTELNEQYGAENGASAIIAAHSPQDDHHLDSMQYALSALARTGPQAPQLRYDGVTFRPGSYFEEPDEAQDAPPTDAEIARDAARLNRIALWFFALLPVAILIAAGIALHAAGAGGN